jgi:hypothetical protein
VQSPEFTNLVPPKTKSSQKKKGRERGWRRGAGGRNDPNTASTQEQKIFKPGGRGSLKLFYLKCTNFYIKIVQYLRKLCMTTYRYI